MRYIHQDNDSYTESGGAMIESSSSDTLSAMLGGRARFLTDAPVDPFMEGDLSYDLIDDFDLPGGVPEPDSERLHGRFGVGIMREAGAAIFEMGMGLHLTDEGYDGYDARLRAVIRF
jgi:outer membrane autotransporter protein